MKIWRLLSVALLIAVSLASSGSPRSEAVALATTIPQVIGTVNVGVQPRGIGIDQTRNLVYVSNWGDATGQGVSKINGATNVASVFSQAVIQPFGVAVNSAANKVLVVNNGDPTVSILRGTDGTLDSSPGVGNASMGIAFDPATGYAYVTSFGSSTLYRLNTATNEVIGFGLTGQPVGVALDLAVSRAYVTLQDRQTIGVVNLNTGIQDLEFSGVFGNVAGIAVNPSNGDIYVVDALEGAVTVVDRNGNLKNALDVFKGDPGNGIPSGWPRAVAINPNTGHIFVTRYDSNQVYVFDTASVVGGGGWISPLAILNVGAGPEFGLAVNTATNLVYAGNMNGNSVTVISDGQKTMQLSTNSINAVTQSNGTVPDASFTISSVSGDSLSWNMATSYTEGNNWMTPSAVTGSGTSSPITVGFNTSPGGVPLTRGTYHGQITVSSDAANSPQNISVTLQVNSYMQLSTNTVAAAAPVGGTVGDTSVT
ncbi:MAG: YncE family protein, partial [Chloroflexi bacterium]|nr:YncE family protein [Chloroflexota bacterium]